jgi:hypothetical protein
MQICIVLLIFFIWIWIMYGNSQDEKTNNIEAMYTYGDSKIKIGGEQGLRYIRTVDGVIEVPNSKTAMYRLFDNTRYNCETSLDDSTEDKSLDYLVKENAERYFRPTNVTATRELTVSPLFETSGVNSYKPSLF